MYVFVVGMCVARRLDYLPSEVLASVKAVAAGDMDDDSAGDVGDNLS